MIALSIASRVRTLVSTNERKAIAGKLAETDAVVVKLNAILNITSGFT
jgi:hypothetical protein